MAIEKFAFPTTIHFGAGARKLVGEHLAKARCRSDRCVVTDRGIAALPLLSEFMAELGGLDALAFSGISGNPVRLAGDGRARRRSGASRRCGDRPRRRRRASTSPRRSRSWRTHPGDVLEYAWDHPQVRPMDQPMPYFVAVPTTAGTGSEVGRSSVISDDVTHVKKILFSPLLLAKAVFADPELTLGLPPAITAATGMDALTHNVESYLSPAYHPLCDGIALEGVRIAARALPHRREATAANLQARSDMLMSSMMGAIAFQKDLGAVHSCAHALSTVSDMHHGLANGIMIDHVMRFNLPAATAKLAELAHVARVPGGDTGSEEARGEAFIAWLAELKAQPRHPGEALRLQGAPRTVSRDDFPRLVEVATADICHQTNPRKCTAADFEQLFARRVLSPSH